MPWKVARPFGLQPNRTGKLEACATLLRRNEVFAPKVAFSVRAGS